ncbi:hypothetical protein BJ166DRAFT_105080 [Pestalotiopsis sp. NC0098]|nr:hypothetical protein BJ166DRAFT_105080 [Pestalotiopsis sp. NC0098]
MATTTNHPRPQPRPSREPLHWPGGIPSHIQIHDEPIKDDSVLADETKGWQQFLEENAPSKSGIEYEGDTSELDQRRHLVSRWASMMQSERDEFHSQAKTRENAYWFPDNSFATGPPHGPAMDPTRRSSTWLYLIDVELPLSQRNRAL